MLVWRDAMELFKECGVWWKGMTRGWWRAKCQIIQRISRRRLGKEGKPCEEVVVEESPTVGEVAAGNPYFSGILKSMILRILAAKT